MSRQEALRLGKKALLFNGIYIGSFITHAYIPLWDYLAKKPLPELCDNFMTTTMVWLCILNIMLSRSNDYGTVKNTLFINAFGFFMWISCYVAAAPVSAISMIYAFYAANKMNTAEYTRSTNR
eukprot:34208_1